MKKIIEDYMSENFTKEEAITYGLIVPALYFVVILLGGLIE